MLDGKLLEGSTPGLRRQITHNDGPALTHGALVNRSRKVLTPMMDGVGEDARLIRAGTMVEIEHTVALDGGQTELQLGTAKENAQLVLQGLKARAGDDRLPVDEITLERGEHLVVGHVERPEHGESGNHELVGRNDRVKGRSLEQRLADPFRCIRRQGWHRPPRAHLDEARIEGQLEMALESHQRPGDGEHDGIVEAELDPVDLPQHDLVGAQDVNTHGRALVDVDAPLEHAVRPPQRPVEGRRAVEAPHAEGHEGGRVLCFPGGGGEHGGHHRLDERAMPREQGEVLDGLQQLRGLTEARLDVAAQRPEDGVVARHQRLPEGSQRAQAQLAGEREARRVSLQGSANVGRGLPGCRHSRPPFQSTRAIADR